jgi:hypothetical protein
MSDFWVDYSQNRRIRTLEEDIAAARSYAYRQSHTLKTELSKLRGNIEAKLNRLAEAFDAFVELSDIRASMAGFAREASVRRRARHLVIGLAERAGNPEIPPPPSVEIEDVPGYWLPPATHGLAALVRADASAAERDIAEAQARDSYRTVVFLSLALGLAGQPESAEPWFEEAFVALSGQTSRVQRVLWVAGATGRYGDFGRSLAARRVDDYVRSLASDPAGPLAEAWRSALPRSDKRLLPPTLRNLDHLIPPLAAHAQLGRLHNLCEQALTTEPSSATLEPPATSSGTGDTGGASNHAHDPRTEMVHALIDEGSPDEHDLLRRVAELRRSVDEDGTHNDPWDVVAGETVELIRSDAFGGHRQLRAISVRACRPIILHLAGETTAAAANPPPERITVPIQRHRISLRPGEPDAADLDAACEEIAANLGTRIPERAGIALAGVGAALLLVGVLTGWFLVIAGIVAGAAGGIVWWIEYDDRRRSAARIAREQGQLRERSQTIANDFATYWADMEGAKGESAALRDKIAAHLA